MIRRLPSKHRNALIPRQKDKTAFLRLGLLLIVGLGLACGFVYAGRQHFAALKNGYDTENLRRQRDELAEERRRLILQREEAASPARLEQAAKRLGMQSLQAAQIDPLRQGADSSKQEPPFTNVAKKRPASRALETNASVKSQAKQPRKPI